jgi:hypothetical protein
MALYRRLPSLAQRPPSPDLRAQARAGAMRHNSNRTLRVGVPSGLSLSLDVDCTRMPTCLTLERAICTACRRSL